MKNRTLEICTSGSMLFTGQDPPDCNRGRSAPDNGQFAALGWAALISRIPRPKRGNNRYCPGPSAPDGRDQ